MEKLNCNLTNCYGIERLDYEFDFANGNVIALYAKNGMMKTSFSKTFKKISEDKEDEIRDEIFDISGIATVTVDGNAIKPKDVFVIKSFESFYESNSITSLLVNDDIKENIKEVLKLRDNFLKKLEKDSGLKISKTSLGKKVFELEPMIMKDFDFSEESFLLNINDINETTIEYECSHIKYSSIFDSSVMKKIETKEFQNKIDEFCKASDSIYQSYDFLAKGKLTFPKFKNIAKSLNNDDFFVNENYIYLAGNYKIKNHTELSEKIKEIETEIKTDPSFIEIEKLLSDSKGIILRDVIENNPEIIPYLKTEKLNMLKKQLWFSYIQKNIADFTNLKNEYNQLEEKINSVEFNDSQWRTALNIFKDRFTVPYQMEISNMKSAIIGENIPKIEFTFEKDDKKVGLERAELESKDILSQGEKRALYLLNIIFDIEKLKQSNEDVLFIVDDIADSFDYKNKYAIVEYLYEMSMISNFKLLILSHNFDFYRTVSSRLSVKRKSCLCAEIDGNNSIIIKEEKYQKQPFIVWKNKLSYINILALIPFVRNLIEYKSDDLVNNNEYMLLTKLLHQKNGSKSITFEEIKEVYKENLGKNNFEGVNSNSRIIDRIYTEADNINTTESHLEHKIIMSMAIRHKAEEYMLQELHSYSGEIVEKGISYTVTEFLQTLESSGNQTRKLYNAFIQFGNPESIKILDGVNIMTPENIHLNSFMYEPLLDMDINELLNLYNKIKSM